MDNANLLNLAKTNRWSEVEQAWMTAIERPEASSANLLAVIDLVIKAGQKTLADTLGWAWLSILKETRSPQDALDVGRALLIHLTDGDPLRDEILFLFKQIHNDRPDLDQWIECSGLKSGKSVRRALRFLDVGLQLRPGVFLVNRTDDRAAKVIELNFDADEALIEIGRRKEMRSIAKLVDEYDVAEEDDFRVLQQLNPSRIVELADEDPLALAVGVVRGQGNKLIREQLKLLLSPKYIPPDKWPDWWNKLKSEVKKSPNLRIEGRSPVVLIYDQAGQSLEQKTWTVFSRAQGPREWLEVLETYLRDTRSQKTKPDTAFLNKAQAVLVERINRFLKHKEPGQAFATALVIERVAADGLPVSTDAHGMAVKMLAASQDPVGMVNQLPDARLWSLAVICLEQAFSDKWPQLFAELILYAPAGQCDGLAKKVEKAGQGDLIPPIVQRALADPGRYTDAVMWVWKGPDISTPVLRPPNLDLFSLIMTLVGPVRASEGRAAGQSSLEMRAKVRAGLSAKDYAVFRECINNLDDSLALVMRRLVERGEGLGPSLQEDMNRILRARFAALYEKPKVAIWDDESILIYSPRGLRIKEQELVEIVNVKMRENAKAIGEAAAHGDLSENSEYKFALEERDLLRARVGKLNREISLSKVLEPGDIPADHVSIGQRITLKSTTDGPPATITILGFDEADVTNHVYSYHSPFARQLLGKRQGEIVNLAIDAAPAADYTIAAIEPCLPK